MPRYLFPPLTPTGMTAHKVDSGLLLAESGSILRKSQPPWRQTYVLKLVYLTPINGVV
jgi:hypothetical protein